MISFAAQKAAFGIVRLSLADVWAVGFDMAFLAAHPAVLFGLVEGAVVPLLLRAPSTVGAMHIVGFHAGIAGLAVLVRLAIHRGALPAAVAVQVLLGRVTIAFLAVLIALFRGQLKKLQWHVGEQPHG